MKTEPNDMSGEERFVDDLRSCFPAAEYPKSRSEARIRASLTQAAPAPAVRSAVRRTLPAWSRFGLAAAAALVLFVSGMEYGRRTTLTTMEAAPALQQVVDDGSLPLAIQGSGTRYVAALARLSDEGASLSAAERRVAVEVALAALYAASVELLREDRNDESMQAVTELVAQKRKEIAVTESQNQF